MGIGGTEIKIQLDVDILDGFLCTHTVCSSDFCIRMNNQIASFQISGVRILYMTTSFFLLNEMIWILIHLILLFALRVTMWFCFCLLKIPGRKFQVRRNLSFRHLQVCRSKRRFVFLWQLFLSGLFLHFCILLPHSHQTKVDLFFLSQI